MLLCSAPVKSKSAKAQAGDSTRARRPHPHHTHWWHQMMGRRAGIYFNSTFNSFQGNNLRNQDVYADNGAPRGSARAPRKAHVEGFPVPESGWPQPDLEALQVTRGGSRLPALDPADICSAYSCQYFFQLCAPLTFGSAKV